MKEMMKKDFVCSKLVGIIHLLLILLVCTNIFIVSVFLWYLSLPAEEDMLATYELAAEEASSPLTQQNMHP